MGRFAISRSEALRGQPFGWRCAIAMTHFCGLSTVTVFLAEILEQPENTVKERLRQWYLDGGAKKGKKRSLILL